MMSTNNKSKSVLSNARPQLDCRERVVWFDDLNWAYSSCIVPFPMVGQVEMTPKWPCNF
jgi:hypothetical protein